MCEGDAGFIDCDTSIPSVSWGMHSFPYIPCCCVSVMGALEGEKVRRCKLQNQNEPFCKRKKVRKEKWRAFTVGFLSINLSADYPGTEELNKCHANASVSPGSITKCCWVFRPLRVARHLRQMPQLINALPLAQQLSNKQDISVGLLSVFCDTERGVEGGGVS